MAATQATLAALALVAKPQLLSPNLLLPHTHRTVSPICALAAANNEPQQCDTTWDSAHEPVSLHMTPAANLVTLQSDVCLKEAAKIMEQNSITGAPVVHDGKVMGILSRTDILYKIAGRRSFFVRGELPRSICFQENEARMKKIEAETVSCAMSRHPTTIHETCTMQDAAALMLRKKHNRLVVVDETGRLAGLLSSTDVLRVALHTTED